MITRVREAVNNKGLVSGAVAHTLCILTNFFVANSIFILLLGKKDQFLLTALLKNIVENVLTRLL